MSDWTGDASRPAEPFAPVDPAYTGPPPTVAPQGFPYGNPYGGWNPYAAAPPAYPYPYPYPGYGPPPGRPGSLVAAAVLGYVSAGLLILAGILLFFGASFLNGFHNTTAEHLTTDFTILGLVNVLAAGLFIGGGVSMTGRHSAGRLLYNAAGVIVLGAAVYWVLHWAHLTGGGTVVYALFFSALAVVGMALAATSHCTQWLRGDR